MTHERWQLLANVLNRPIDFGKIPAATPQPNGKVMAVAVNLNELGTAHPLFGTFQPPLGHGYDVTKEGRRFLVRVEVQADEPLTLVQNWTGLLRKYWAYGSKPANFIRCRCSPTFSESFPWIGTEIRNVLPALA